MLIRLIISGVKIFTRNPKTQAGQYQVRRCRFSEIYDRFVRRRDPALRVHLPAAAANGLSSIASATVPDIF
jgi:hypothetical protein